MRKIEKERAEAHGSDIDFVVLWVDGNDPDWKEKKSKFTPEDNEDVSDFRYRQWDNLKYWFRGVAKYAPWVRTIHFVTDGQVPHWLNLANPQLHHVTHSDFMPEDALPTFSSSAIEIGMHKIDGLSDKFVLFNDDMFLINEIAPDYYFCGNTPIDMAGLTRPESTDEENIFAVTMRNNYAVINKHFSKKDVFNRVGWKKWFQPAYKKTFLRTLLNCTRSEFDGMVIPHCSTPYVKKDFEKVWELEEELLMETQRCRFRTANNNSHFLFRFWRLCSGDFHPRRSLGKYIGVRDEASLPLVVRTIIGEHYPEICINDIWEGNDFEYAKVTINKAFEKKLWEKCEYEI